MLKVQDRHCTCNNRLYCERNHGIVEYPPQVIDPKMVKILAELDTIPVDVTDKHWYESADATRRTELFRQAVAPFNTY